MPQNFDSCAKSTLYNGFWLWMDRQPVYKIELKKKLFKAPICSYRLMKPSMLSPSIRSKYWIYWCPIFRLMEEAVGFDPNGNTSEMYKKGLAYIKTKLSFIFY